MSIKVSKIISHHSLFLILTLNFNGLPAQTQSFKKSNHVLETWRQAFLECVREEALSPNLMLRNMTLFSVSTHDALNSYKQRYKTFLPNTGNPPEIMDPVAIIAGCGWVTAKTLHPHRQSKFNKLSLFARVKDANTGVKNGFEHGKRIAKKILHLRRDDGASTSVSYIAKNSPGEWRRTPNFYRPPEQPHWREVNFWTLQEIDSFLPPPPPLFDSKDYASAVSEAKKLGGKKSQLRTPEESLIAKFWKDFSYTQTPPGHWNEIANFVARSKKIDLWQEARLFALLNLAMSDAGIVAWKAKYLYHLWRPLHAIQNGKQFPTTWKLQDQTWEPFLETPPHPEYPSAHSCFSGSASNILALFFGNDRFSFRVTSDQYPGKFRGFKSFSECAEEIGRSRLLGGIHYNFSNKAGIKYGKKIGLFVYNNFLQSLQKEI